MNAFDTTDNCSAGHRPDGRADRSQPDGRRVSGRRLEPNGGEGTPAWVRGRSGLLDSIWGRG